MYLFDTDILVGLLREDSQASHKLKDLLERQTELHTSSVNLHELIKGAYLSKHPEKNMSRVIRLIQSFSLLGFDEEAALISGKLSADKEMKGKMIEQNDIFIAALALTHNLTLITRNKKHFESIEGLQIEVW
ncbi:MAG TPA: type II toxin-antitoxin system VapC family toxin [Candidatus Nanoarchaeia archaeon]|nr:type II toxin-antitoxin system VapC family toxin [Candidatus Nanoarchaeia archaeon]